MTFDARPLTLELLLVVASMYGSKPVDEIDWDMFHKEMVNLESMSRKIAEGA